MRQEIIREANYQDGDDCAKKFLCELSGKYLSDLEWDEELLFNVYNQPVLDYSAESLFFNIAVKVKLRINVMVVGCWRLRFVTTLSIMLRSTNERFILTFCRLVLKAGVPVLMFILNVCSSLKNSGEYYRDKVRAASTYNIPKKTSQVASISDINIWEWYTDY